MTTQKETLEILLQTNANPIILRCSDDETWKRFLNEYDPVIIDVTKIKNSELFGTNFDKRDYAKQRASAAAGDYWEELWKVLFFEPIWLKELNSKKRKTLVLLNFDQVPYHEINPSDLSEEDACPFERMDEVTFGQAAYFFLLRNREEGAECRKLNADSPYSYPIDATTFLIQKPNPKYRICEPIMSRASLLDLDS